MADVFEGKSIGLDQKRRAPHLENQELGYGLRYTQTQRIQFAFKSVQIGS
jgi:hypothetical protein